MWKIFLFLVLWGNLWHTYALFDYNIVAGIHALIAITNQVQQGQIMGELAVAHFLDHLNLPLEWTVYILHFTFEKCADLDPKILQDALEVVTEAYSHHEGRYTYHSYGLEPQEWLENHWRELEPRPPAPQDPDLSYYMRTWHQNQRYPRKTPPPKSRPPRPKNKRS